MRAHRVSFLRSNGKAVTVYGGNAANVHLAATEPLYKKIVTALVRTVLFTRYRNI
jgi:hypothetical protein